MSKNSYFLIFQLLSVITVIFSTTSIFVLPTLAIASSDYDRELTKELKIMADFSHYSGRQDSNDDKVQAAGGKVKSLLLKWAGDPALMTDKLSGARAAGLGIVESKDHKLRFYSWDTMLGGTMHYFDAVAQYRSGNNTKGFSLIEDPSGENGSGASYESIETFKTKSGETVYVSTGILIGSTIDSSDEFAAWAIKNGSLQKVKFFKPKGKAIDTITCNKPSKLPNENNPAPHIHFADNNLTLKVPLVEKDDSFHNKYLIYKFNGSVFEYKEIGK